MKLSHVGIVVMDFDRMVEFYKGALGLVVSDTIPGKLVFMTSQVEDHHQIVLEAGRPEGLRSRDLLNQVSFQLDDLEQLRSAYQRVVALGATEVSPVTHGNAWGLYFRDPEGNRLEMFVETPWYIAQPHLTVIDLTKPASQIYAETEALCRSDPSFMTNAEWRSKTVRTLSDVGA